MSRKNLYAVLELSYDCSKDDIERAYYFYAKIYHSEINPKTGNLYKELTDAYNILINPETRRNYDLSEGILSKAILVELENLIKFDIDLPNEFISIVIKTYDNAKNKNDLKGIIKTIIEKTSCKDHDIIQLIKKYIKCRQEEDAYKNNKIVDNNIAFPFDWYDEGQYYMITDKQPIFEILHNINKYRFENICKSIYNRSFIVIFGTIFVYSFVLPLIIRNKIFKSYLPSVKIATYKYEIKWLRYFMYLLAENKFWKTFGLNLFLQCFVLAKIIGNISYCLYWIFDRILKVFILPFAYVFKWIILIFFILWLFGR